MTAVLNVCLDLNVWCAAFLADRKGHVNTASQALVQMVRTGQAGGTPVQLVVSWGMLTRLRKVLEEDWGVSRSTADMIIEAISGYARLGAAGTPPHLTLGGTGIIPIRDAEDAHVLETAIAGRAHLLVTANFDDFIAARTKVLDPGKVALFETATTKFTLAHPFRAAAWLRDGTAPTPDMVAGLFGLSPF